MWKEASEAGSDTVGFEKVQPWLSTRQQKRGRGRAKVDDSDATDDDADDAAPAVDDDDESTPSNHCSEDNDCNTCFSCCKDYLSDQDSCDGCVTEMC